ncbi:hypothetical protein JMJ35_006102 [Cladonia borealis]|uniref:acetyl-CoA C-acyltransferase n=1 Tax=Cladonia borealis TaxID=184061 RepID=A0AA39V4N3_9LECA|nr:hypothetical protein JMJ35_006102 [Cladonia borealis]
MAQFQKGMKNILQKHPNDVVFLSALRTPITRSYKGGLRNAYPEQMLAAVLRATLDQNPNVPPSNIQDVAVGTVLSELGGSKAARMALNHVGYPSSTSLYTVNRACASSLQAITTIADSISVGRINIGIGAGTESMTRNYASKAVPTDLWPDLKSSPVKEARDCIMPMGITSENVAERYNISRADQDAFGALSHTGASTAQKSGLFAKEIVPVLVTNPPSESQPSEETLQVTQDDGIRHNATTASMAKLKPVFKETGTTTAGNSSQISDGASATLLCRRSTATALGLSPIGKFAGSAVVGVPPDEMGIGPAYAIPALLSAAGISKEDVGVWEINEAFASQALYCIRELGLEGVMEKGRVNPRGGAIALGHPLGATGGRMVSTILHEMEGGQVGEVGVVSMCVGTGMGMAGLIVRE